MSILNKYTWSSLLNNKKRTIVTLIGVVLSCALICGTVIIGESVQQMLLQSYIDDTGNYHVSFINIPLSKADNIVNSKETKNVAITKSVGYSKLDNKVNEFKPFLYVNSYNEQAFSTFGVTVLKGRLPQNSNEIIISASAINIGKNNYEVGQKLKLDLGVRKIEDEVIEQHSIYNKDSEVFEPKTTKEYTIVGIMQDLKMEPPVAPGYTAITTLDINDTNYSENVSVFTQMKRPKNVFKFGGKFIEDNKINKNQMVYNSGLLRAMGVTGNEQLNKALIIVMGVLISLIIVASVALIYNSFAISVSERKKQFGLLKSVGATPRQLRKIVYKEAALIGMISIPIGLLCGIFGIWVVLTIANHLLVDVLPSSYRLGLVVSPYIIISTIVFLGITLLLSAWLPAKRASKISAIDNIRQNHDIKIKNKKRGFKSRFLTKLFGFEADLANKSIKRNAKRYRTTVFSLAISIILFLVFSTFINSTFRAAGTAFQSSGVDVTLHGTELNYNKANSIQLELAKDTDVNRVRITNTTAINSYLPREKISDFVVKNFPDRITQEADGMYKVAVRTVAIPDEDMRAYLKENKLSEVGYFDVNNTKVVYISKTSFVAGKIYENPVLNISVGEKILNYHKDGINIEATIGDIAKEAPFGIPKSDTRPTIFISKTVADSMFNKFEHTKDNYTVLIDAKNPKEFIKGVYDAEYSNDLAIIDHYSRSETNSRMTILLSILCYGFISVITLIGITNIFNSINTSIMLRRREFAMLKSVGLSQRGFNKMLNFESIFYGLGSLVWSLPIGLLLSAILIKGFSDAISTTTSLFHALPWKEVAFCSVFIVIIVAIITRYSTSKIKKDNIVEALRNESI